MKNRKIGNFLVFPKFQLTLVILNLLVLSINFMVIIVLFSQGTETIQTMLQATGIANNASMLKVWQNYEQFLYTQLIVTTFVVFISTLIFTLIVTHRVVGPIYSLKNFFLKIGDSGQIEELKFRSKDYYGELPGIINRALRKISNNSQSK